MSKEEEETRWVDASIRWKDHSDDNHIKNDDDNDDEQAAAADPFRDESTDAWDFHFSDTVHVALPFAHDVMFPSL
jgi:hypothetical protein